MIFTPTHEAALAAVAQVGGIEFALVAGAKSTAHPPGGDIGLVPPGFLQPRSAIWKHRVRGISTAISAARGWFVVRIEGAVRAMGSRSK